MLVVSLVLGLCLGSFVNVLVLRLAAGESLLGRSRCPHCLRQLAWYENIPVFSFIALQARCRTCRGPISWQYPLVEGASGLVWVLAYLRAYPSGGWLGLVSFGLFATILLSLFVFDLKWSMLPDEVTLPSLALVILLNLSLGADWLAVVVAALLGALWFAFQYFFSHGRWVGDGDIRLGALMGAMLAGWQNLVVALFLAYVVGSVVAAFLLMTHKRNWQSQLPMGVFLAPATLVALFWGNQIWQWYVGLSGW